MASEGTAEASETAAMKSSLPRAVLLIDDCSKSGSREWVSSVRPWMLSIPHPLAP